MACSSEIKGNIACTLCTLKGRMRHDAWNSNYLKESSVPSVAIVTKPGDSMAGTSNTKVVYCDRDLGIPVK